MVKIYKAICSTHVLGVSAMPELADAQVLPKGVWAIFISLLTNRYGSTSGTDFPHNAQAALAGGEALRGNNCVCRSVKTPRISFRERSGGD